MHDMPETVLIRRCIEGHRNARDAFARKYAISIFKTVYHTLKRLSQTENIHDSSMDLAHDVFVNLFKNECLKLKKYHHMQNIGFSAWLKTVVKNYVIDHIKKKKVRCVDIHDFHLADPQPLPDENLSAQADLDSVYQAISALDPLDQLILRYRYEDGLSVRDIARIMNRKEPMIHNRIRRARDKLKAFAEENNIL